MDLIQKGLVYAIIPARSGSVSVKNKNIRMIAGHPMMTYSIAAAKLTPGIQRVIVSTDSEEYADIARKYGADVPFLRPKEISGSDATELQFMQHAINWCAENEKVLPEFWVHLRPTAPLREPQLIEQALQQMIADKTADSLRSAHRTLDCPFKWFWEENGYYRAFNGISLDEANGPRQAFPPVYIPDGYVDVLRTECIVGNNQIERMIAFQSPETIDVDYIGDLERLEEASSSYINSITEYLNNVKAGERA